MNELLYSIKYNIISSLECYKNLRVMDDKLIRKKGYNLLLFKIKQIPIGNLLIKKKDKNMVIGTNEMIIRFLIDNGIDINFMDIKGDTSLTYIIKKCYYMNCYSTVILLLLRLNIEIRGTELLLALQHYCDDKIIKILIKKTKNNGDGNSYNILFNAVQSHYELKMIKFLMKQFKYEEILYKYRTKLAMDAIYYLAGIDVILYLIKKTKNKYLRNDIDKNILDYARGFSIFDIIQYLKNVVYLINKNNYKLFYI